MLDYRDVIDEIVQRLYGQQKKGLEKYGVPVNPSAQSLLEWMEHDLQEQTDHLVYSTAAKERMAELVEELATLESVRKSLQDALLDNRALRSRVADLEKQLADRDSTIKAFWDDFRVKDQQIADLTRERDGYRQQWEECKQSKQTELEVKEGFDAQVD